LIFTRTKRAAAKLVEELNDRGFNAAAVHGDLNQEQRERAMAAFKAGKKDILIATDVASRGIDVLDVTHVINHTIPEDEKTYLHRVGRTGRAGKTGIAVTFVDWDDLHKWALINRAREFGQPEPIETYSSSPHLYADLNIPEGAKGRLKPTPAPKGDVASRGAASSGPRNRRRTRGGSTGADAAGAASGPGSASGAAAATGTHDGPGTHDGHGAQHHDGNSAPRRRSRNRRRGGGGTSSTPAA
jgi:superfamily II DNA/RNA helicase